MGLRGAIALAVILLAAGTATAGTHKVFVLRADSTTDWATRTHVEKTVVGLARNVDRGVSRGDMSLDDLELSAGCTKGLDACRTTLLDTLMIDELVVIGIVPSGDDKVKVTVRRATKAGIREATAVADKADPDPALLASIGPLFGAHKVIGEKPAPPAATPPPQHASQGTMTVGKVEVDNERPPEPRPAAAAVESKPASPPPEPKPEPKPAPTPPPAPVASAEPAPQPATVTAAPNNVVEGEPDSRRPIYIGGMVAGGAVMLVGVLLWEKASGLESDAKAAPNRTSADIAHLLDLESSGDHYALAGNITFVGGLALAGVSGYLFWRSRDHAHVAPMTVDHGGGVALTFEVP